MVPDAAPMIAVIIVIFCLTYFAMASIPFLFVRLDIPEVWRLFRGLFNVYFGVVGVIAIVAAVLFATSGSLVFPAGMLLLAGSTHWVRQPVMQSIDMQQDAGRSGDPEAMRRLRRIHWGAMLVNVAVLALVAGSVPILF